MLQYKNILNNNTINITIITSHKDSAKSNIVFCNGENYGLEHLELTERNLEKLPFLNKASNPRYVPYTDVNNHSKLFSILPI